MKKKKKKKTKSENERNNYLSAVSSWQSLPLHINRSWIVFVSPIESGESYKLLLIVYMRRVLLICCWCCYLYCRRCRCRRRRRRRRLLIKCEHRLMSVGVAVAFCRLLQFFVCSLISQGICLRWYGGDSFMNSFSHMSHIVFIQTAHTDSSSFQ